jgi:diaminopimelate epimerase
MRFAKGHGTGNDFLILPDPDGALELSPEFVVSLCDRRTGLGADGILRAVRVAEQAPDLEVRAGRPPGTLGAGPALDAAEWFMDYRNADGSMAEMCGNGLRVFARYLLAHDLADGPAFVVATRAGLRQVWAEASGEITVDMGAPLVLGRSVAVVGGTQCLGLAVSLGNPHLACMVSAPVAGLDLSAPPVVDPARFPDGANVEVVRVRGDRHLEMRVYERGSGVTLSCGTGAVAAAVAAAQEHVNGTAAGGERSGPGGRWTVDVPGGRLVVTLGETTSLLTGPAVIVADGELDPAWLSDLTSDAVSGIA